MEPGDKNNMMMMENRGSRYNCLDDAMDGADGVDSMDRLRLSHSESILTVITDMRRQGFLRQL